MNAKGLQCVWGAVPKVGHVGEVSNSMSIWSRVFILVLFASPTMAAEDGAALYGQYCAQCHDGGAARAPTRAALGRLRRTDIVRALESGKMREQGAGRTEEERSALAEFLSRRRNADPTELPPVTTFCESRPELNLSDVQWNGWGASSANNRFEPAAYAGLTLMEVPKLRLKWAFGFPNATSAAVQPTVVGKWVFVASTAGRIYALDIDKGCVYWAFDAGQSVRTAISVAPVDAGSSDYSAFFMDVGATAYALDARTGQVRWKTQVGKATQGGTGSPTYYAGRLYVPLTGGGEGAGGDGCCTTHGAVAALDAKFGKVLWLSSTLDTEPHPTRKSDDGVQLFGPSGASVWSAPTVDLKTSRVYVGTGDGHSSPAGSTSDSILAFDIKTGVRVWTHQATPRDAYNSGCDRRDLKGCPEENGPDWDFGQPPALVSLPDGKRLLVAGQKSGVVYAFDPDNNGREVWKVRVGVGGVLGGVNWGVAADSRNVYVAVSDHLDIVERDAKLGPTAGGLVAIRLKDGKELWRTNVSGCAEHQGTAPISAAGPAGAIPSDYGCSPAQSAAVSLIPGVVFSGSLDGHLRAYDAENGRVVWDFDTARYFIAVNFVEARGGSIDVGGPAVVNGTVLTTSGYSNWGGMPGNVLLAFSVQR